MRLFRVFSALLVVAILACATPAVAQEDVAPDATPIFRVFLKDGTALAAWGEYARVGKSLVLTIPIGKGTKWSYEFVSVPLLKIDLAKTDRYAEAVRAAQFAKSRGKEEFANLSDSLSTQLGVIQTMPNPKDRLVAAEGARKQLIDWANTSHGYRAEEVQQLMQEFDSAIIDLRVAAGESRFAINLSAGPLPPKPPKLMDAPTTLQSVGLALHAAAVADSPDTRKAVLATARDAAASIKGKAGSSLRHVVAEQLSSEATIDAQYNWFVRDVRREAGLAVRSGNARGVEAQRRRIALVDRHLGHRRPDMISSLSSELDTMRDQAAEERLVLDNWDSIRQNLAKYQAAVAPLVRDLAAERVLLQAIKDLASTPLTSLVRAETHTSQMVTTFSGISAPDEAAHVQDLLAAAIERADFAVRARRRAVSGRELAAARDAASAAGDALASLKKIPAALTSMMRPPKASR